MARGLLLLLLAVHSAWGAYPPTGSAWARVPSNPVLRPEGWEGNCVCENVALYDNSTASYVMFYRGGWGTTAVGRATSPDGISWTKDARNPVFGAPTGADGGQPWVYRDARPDLSGELRLFTTNNGSPPRVLIATSTDAGRTWARAASSISLPPEGTLWGNRVVWREGAQWFMLQEVLAGPWQVFLYNSSDGFAWAVQHSGLPLSSLQLHAGGMYGGPRFASIDGVLTPRWPSDGLYHLWMHATNASGGLPTDVYHATSLDLLAWSVTPGPALRHLGTGFEYDQAAGPVPLAVGGRALLYYDGDNNNVGACAIGLVEGVAARV